MAMAASRRHQHTTASTSRSLVDAASDNMVPPSNTRKPRGNRKRDKTKPQQQGLEVPRLYESEVDDSDRSKQWTPEPEPYDPETYAAWGRQHFGDDWFEQRKIMLEERNFYINRDQVYEERSRALRIMEHDRQTGKLPLKGKTWEELMAWARIHYGEAWYQQRQILDRLEREELEATDPKEKDKIISKHRKCGDLIRDIQMAKDEAMLAEGKTWHDIMAFPADSSKTTPSTETEGYALHSPSPSSDGSGYNTYPPTPTTLGLRARHGPVGPERDPEWQQDELEWRAVNWRWTEEQYEEGRLNLRATIRSWRDDEDGQRRREAVLKEIEKVKYEPGTLVQTVEYQVRMKRFDLLCQGWTQEQIDEEERAEHERYEQRQEWRKNHPPNQPRDHKEMNERLRTWDEDGISRVDQIELARLYGYDARATSPDGHLESVVPSQSHTSTTNGSLRKGRRGRIAKPAPKTQSRLSPSLEAGQRRGTSGSDQLVELGNNTSIEPRERPRSTDRERKPHRGMTPSTLQLKPGRGRKVKSTDVNTAERADAPKLRRSSRITEKREREARDRAEQQDEAVQSTASIDNSGSVTTRKNALDQPRPSSKMISGSDAVAPARGALRSRIAPSKASKPQGVMKRGRPRKK